MEDPGIRLGQTLRFHKKPSPAHLILDCEDVDDESLGIRVANADQVDKALIFARQHAAKSLLVHCLHGVGRSAAIGLAILADRLGPSQEDQAVEILFQIRPSATPNLVVTRLADLQLGRQGALVDALARWESVRPEMAQKRADRLSFARANLHLYARL